MELIVHVNGSEVAVSAHLEPLPRAEGLQEALPGVLSRVMAAEMMREFGAPRETVEALAVRYGLMSPLTNYVMVMERADGEKAEDLPVIRKVPQTLAAGWHGMGTVAASCPDVAVSCQVESESSSKRVMASHDLSIPMYLRRGRKVPASSADHIPPSVWCQQVDEDMERNRSVQTNNISRIDSIIARFNGMHSIFDRTLKCQSMNDLKNLGLPEELLESVSIESEVHGGEKAVVAFLLALEKSASNVKMSRHALRLLRKRAAGFAHMDPLVEDMYYEILEYTRGDLHPATELIADW